MTANDTTDHLERPQPRDIDAERAVLGAMMLNPRTIDLITRITDVTHFHEPQHQTIYQAIVARYVTSSHRPKVDPITISSDLLELGALGKVGGSTYIHGLVSHVPDTANADRYAEIIRNMWVLRCVIKAGTQVTSRGYAGSDNPADIVSNAIDDLQASISGMTAEEAKLSVADRWSDYLLELNAGADPNALDTPWPDLNNVISLKPGNVITVGAATGGGKSLFALNLAAHVALTHSKPAVVASMEMGGNELMSRLTAAEAGVDVSKLERRSLTDNDWTKIIRVSDRMQNAHNFILDDSANLTIGKLRTRLRWMTSRGTPAAICIVDYLQLLTPENSSSTKNRANEVAELSRGLKLLAGEFRIPVVALAQFNRSATGRDPLVSDFKDSSSIEQDSNIIILMSRPLADDGTDTGPRAGEIDLHVAKNRQGRNNVIVSLAFQGRFARLKHMGAAT